MDDLPDGIGARLRRLREARNNMGVRALADLSGVAASTVSAIETGRRQPRLTHIFSLANALQVAPSALMGAPIPTPGNGKADAAVKAVGQAVVGAQIDRPGGQVVPVPALEERVAAAQHLRYRAGFEELGQILPGLIRDLHTTLAAGRDVGVLLDAIVLCHVDVTGMWLRDAWASADLRMQVATLARRCAERRETPDAVATAAFGLAHTLTAAGMPDVAWDVLEDAPTTPLPGVRGAHLTTYARIAAVTGGDIEAPLSEVAELATSTGEIGMERHGFALGPTNSLIHRMNMQLEAGQVDAAIATARQVEPERHPYRTRQAAYWATLGQALAADGRAKSRAEAVRAFQLAEQIFAARVRRSLPAQTALQAMVTRAKDDAVGRDLRGLAARAGLAV